MRISTVQLVTLVTLFVCITATIAGSESQNSDACKGFCDHCGCTGFYCGEECICECNEDDNNPAAGECIATVQNNAKKMRADFEILIQGPRENKFLQDAQEFEQNQHCLNRSQGREKRNTVVIYKPNALKDEVTKIHSKIENLEKAIVKREGDLIRQKRQNRPNSPWFRREEPLFKSVVGGKFSLDSDDEELEKPEKMSNTKKPSEKITKNAESLVNVDAPKSLNNQKNFKPVKRFIGLNALKSSKLFDNIFTTEPLPKCLLDVNTNYVTNKFSQAVRLLKKASDDLMDNVNNAIIKQNDCFGSVSPQSILSKLKNLPGVSCLEKLFPQVRLCDLLDFKSTSSIFNKLVGDSLIGDTVAATAPVAEPLP